MPQPTLLSVRVADGENAETPQPTVSVIAVVLDVDVVDHAGDLRLAPSLLDMQRANDVGPTLTAERRRTGNGWAVIVRRVTAGHVGAAAEDPPVPWLSADSVAVKPPPNEAV